MFKIHGGHGHDEQTYTITVTRQEMIFNCSILVMAKWPSLVSCLVSRNGQSLNCWL